MTQVGSRPIAPGRNRSVVDRGREVRAPGPRPVPRRARWWAFGRAYVDEVGEDRLPGLAAEVAFFSVLGVFPGMLILTGLLGNLDRLVGADLAQRVERRVVGTLDTVLTERAGPVLAAVRGLFDEQRGSLLTLAAAGSLVTLSGAFAVVIAAINIAHDTVDGRSWIRRRLMGLGLGLVTLLAAVLALAVFVVGPLLGGGRAVAEAAGMGSHFVLVWQLARYPLAVAGIVGWTTALLRYAPRPRIAWREALPGALLATALWAAASAGLHLYLVVAAGANPVLGAFGGGAIVMIWLYLLGLSLLLGGELNATLRRRRGRAARRPAARFEEGARPLRVGRAGAEVTAPARPTRRSGTAGSAASRP
ncbi:YihY/virulence factor BrkB family protein [Pseudonocardia sp. RS010]|uniref:YihY/virulence factor BrkB family protein n=1 Tax=Pseudonocardia sp. RS010 TaxID=3385979 RepID=UPI0039A2257C